MTSEPTRSPRSTRLLRAGIGLALAALVVVIVLYSRHGGDDAASRGRWAAETHCGGCHDVSAAAQAGRRSGVPSFVLLAQGGVSRDAVVSFLTRQHRAMPAFRLTAEERADLAAYLASLAPGRQ